MSLKTIITALFFLSCFSNSTAQIKFFPGEQWDLAVASSEQNNKPIFIDFYTTWCVPCKKMDVSSFTDTVVVDLLNSKFVSIKVNAELDQNKYLVDQFHVKAYPTLVILDSEKKTLFNSAGYKDQFDLRKLLKSSLSFLDEEQQNNLSKFENLKQEDIDNFIVNYAQLNSNHHKELKKYIYRKGADKKEIYGNEVLFLLDNYEPKDPFDIIINNIPQKIELVQTMPWITKFNKLFQILFYQAKRGRTIEDFELVANAYLLANNNLKKASTIALNPNPIKEIRKNRLEMYDSMQNYDSYFTLADSMINEFILIHDIAKIRKMDHQKASSGWIKSQMKDLRDEKSETALTRFRFENLNASGLANRLDGIAKTLLLNSSHDQEKMNKSLFWINHSIALLDTPDSRIIKSGILKKLDRFDESEHELKLAQQSQFFEKSHLDLIDFLAL